MTLEEFKEHAKIMDKEEFIQRMVEGGSATCPSKYGLEESCGRDCEECARNAVKDIKFKDDIEVVLPLEKAPKELIDNVNHPNHYTQGKYEVIDYIEDKLSKEELQGYCVGNVLKYVSRFKHKNGLEDLKKAEWYLNRLITNMEGKEC